MTGQKLAEDRRRYPPYLAFGRGFVSTEDNYGAADAKVQLNGNGCVYVAEYICDDRDHRHDAEIDQVANDYVAWCRYIYDDAGGIQSIETCDSDAEGAFKVYRRPATTPPTTPSDAAMRAAEEIETRAGLLPLSLLDEIQERRDTLYQGFGYEHYAPQMKTDLDSALAIAAALRTQEGEGK